MRKATDTAIAMDTTIFPRGQRLNDIKKCAHSYRGDCGDFARAIVLSRDEATILRRISWQQHGDDSYVPWTMVNFICCEPAAQEDSSN